MGKNYGVKLEKNICFFLIMGILREKPGFFNNYGELRVILNINEHRW